MRAPLVPSSLFAAVVSALSVVCAACSDPASGTGGGGATSTTGASTVTGAVTTGTSATTGAATTGTGGGASTGSTTSTTGTGMEVPDPGTMTSDARLYTTDGTEFLIDDVGSAFAHAVAGGAVDNVIVYVHGRACGGGEPSKSLSGSMPELETDYGARAIMFNWQGADVGCPLGFPEDEARAAGTAFAHTLHKLAYDRFIHPAVYAGLRITLLTHSMGSLVLEEATSTDTVAFPPGLFDTAVINAAASARDGHDAWLSTVVLSPHLYVTENDDDKVLLAASALGGTRLGKNVDGVTLASNAVYVDFTASTVNHAYYIHSGQDGAHMTAFYDAVMNGLAFDFASAPGIASTESRDGTFVYHFDAQ